MNRKHAYRAADYYISKYRAWVNCVIIPTENGERDHRANRSAMYRISRILYILSRVYDHAAIGLSSHPHLARELQAELEIAKLEWNLSR